MRYFFDDLLAFWDYGDKLCSVEFSIRLDHMRSKNKAHIVSGRLLGRTIVVMFLSLSMCRQYQVSATQQVLTLSLASDTLSSSSFGSLLTFLAFGTR